MDVACWLCPGWRLLSGANKSSVACSMVGKGWAGMLLDSSKAWLLQQLFSSPATGFFVFKSTVEEHYIDFRFSEILVFIFLNSLAPSTAVL